MSTLIIPTLTDGTPWYDFEIDLDGATYSLEFKWNPVDVAWSLSIYDATRTLILSERKLVLGVPLTKQFRLLGLPPGEFTVVDTSGQQLEAGLTDLGARVLLLYTESASLPASFKI
jgi:hypothetical protein